MKNRIKVIILFAYCLTLYSCDSNYDRIKDFFPQDIERNSAFLMENKNSSSSDTVNLYEKTWLLDRKINFLARFGKPDNPILFQLSITPKDVIVEADSSRFFNELHKTHYSRKTSSILTRPEPLMVQGWYKEPNENDSIRLSIQWPHPYWLYFFFEGSDLIIEKYTTFKSDYYYKYYFSRQQGLYKIEIRASEDSECLTSYQKLIN
jgi:hypothetical protein